MNETWLAQDYISSPDCLLDGTVITILGKKRFQGVLNTLGGTHVLPTALTSSRYSTDPRDRLAGVAFRPTKDLKLLLGCGLF